MWSDITSSWPALTQSGTDVLQPAQQSCDDSDVTTYFVDAGYQRNAYNDALYWTNAGGAADGAWSDLATISEDFFQGFTGQTGVNLAGGNNSYNATYGNVQSQMWQSLQYAYNIELVGAAFRVACPSIGSQIVFVEGTIPWSQASVSDFSPVLDAFNEVYGYSSGSFNGGFFAALNTQIATLEVPQTNQVRVFEPFGVTFADPSNCADATDLTVLNGNQAYLAGQCDTSASDVCSPTPSDASPQGCTTAQLYVPLSGGQSVIEDISYAYGFGLTGTLNSGINGLVGNDGSFMNLSYDNEKGDESLPTWPIYVDGSPGIWSMAYSWVSSDPIGAFAGFSPSSPGVNQTIPFAGSCCAADGDDKTTSTAYAFLLTPNGRLFSLEGYINNEAHYDEFGSVVTFKGKYALGTSCLHGDQCSFNGLGSGQGQGGNLTWSDGTNVKFDNPNDAFNVILESAPQPSQ